MNRIIEGIQHFQDEVFPQQRGLFEKLAHAQHPETLVITCSDSRISLELMTQTSPGELFVCRNAGNIVPSYGRTDASSASVEYALSVLPIRDVIVCGHSDCGAMKGLVNPSAVSRMPHVKSWLTNSQQALSGLEWQVDGVHSHEVVNKLSKLNVRLQMEHLQTYPMVLPRLRDGSLRLHGWFFRIDSCTVEQWESETGTWTPLGAVAPAAAPAVHLAAGSEKARHA